MRPTAIHPRESCGSAVGSSQDHAWVHVWKAPLLSSASVQACPNHRCQCRVGQLILRCTYTSTNQWVSNPAQDRLGAWLCASYLTSLCPLPLSENQVTVRNKYVTCKTHQCLDVISGMLMLSAVTIIVTIYRGNAEIKAAERSQQAKRQHSNGSFLPLWESAMAEGLPIHCLLPPFIHGETEAQEANVELGHEATFPDARLRALSTGLWV